jgi:ABC-type transport system involved in multi-copper enzyme maturation permease subunit
MLGSLFDREVLTQPRRVTHFAGRVIFVLAMFMIVCTAWLLLAGIQPVTSIGNLTRFSSLVFQIIAPFQVIVVMCIATLAGATAVSSEKDKRTFILLLMTSLSNWEIVIGKMSAGFLSALNLFAGSVVVMMSLTLLGGVSINQVFQVAWITLGAIFACGAFGATIGFWREKTFQAIALSLLGITLFLTFAEVAFAGVIPGVDPAWGVLLSPLRATTTAARPIPELATFFGIQSPWISGAILCGIATALVALSIQRLRIWNPSREGRPLAQESEGDSNPTDLKLAATWKVREPRRVWDNPILWREMCTWAYGRKVLIVRLAYLLFGSLIVAGLYFAVQSGIALQKSNVNESLVPETAMLLAPLFVVSLIIINALAVNSITNERDGQALDLLLVTEITPRSFLFGKLVGVLYVAKEMVLLPMGVCIWLSTQGAVSGENLVFSLIGLLVMDVFVAMLGIHCGMIYSKSRSAIGTSLGTVFFLFLGVVTCMLIMIGFRGSFGRQLAPFLAIIIGGGAGLYVALGHRNPSPAITLAAFGLPFLTFFAITSFIIRDQELTVFSVLVTAYGFTTLAMMVPALSEFEFAFGRSQMAKDEG